MLIKNILKGWGKSLGFLPSSLAEKKMQELRLNICKHCPHVSESKVLKLLNGNATYESSKACSKCSCPLIEKTIVAEEKCPLNKW